MEKEEEKSKNIKSISIPVELRDIIEFVLDDYFSINVMKIDPKFYIKLKNLPNLPAWKNYRKDCAYKNRKELKRKIFAIIGKSKVYHDHGDCIICDTIYRYYKTEDNKILEVIGKGKFKDKITNNR